MQNGKDLRAKLDWNTREPKRNGTEINAQRENLEKRKNMRLMHEKVKEVTDGKKNIRTGSGFIMSKEGGDLIFKKNEVKKKLSTVHR